MAFICVEIKALDLSDFTIPLPGGIEVGPIISARLASATDLIMSTISQASPALAAFIPFMKMLSAMEAAAAVLKGIPEAIITLNPLKIFDDLVAFALAMAELLKLLPPLVLPLSVMRFISIMILLMEEMIDTLYALNSAVEDAEHAIQKGQEREDEDLIAIGQCALSNVEAEVERHMTIIHMIGAPIRIINVFLALFGQPCFRFDPDPDMDLDGLIHFLQALIDFLTKIDIDIPDLPTPDLCDSYWEYDPLTGKMIKVNA